MTVQEISELISTEATENPVVDIDALYSPDSPMALKPMAEWINKSRAPTFAPADDDDQSFTVPEAAVSCDWSETMEAHLFMQLNLKKLTELQNRICRKLVHYVDERGYLDIDSRAEALRLAVSERDVEDCLSILRGLEPVGICAKDMKACLKEQLLRQNGDALALAIVESYLTPLAKGHYSAIAKALKVTTAEVKNAADTIRRLEPIPSVGFQNDRRTSYLVPDIIVEILENGPEVKLNMPFAPYFKISSQYLKLYNDQPDDEVRAYLDSKLKSAHMMAKNLMQRERTILNCAKAIVDIQSAFFTDNGLLVPMTMADVADRIGMHTSTVSRAVRDKYVQCSRGTMPIRLLFTRKLESDKAELSSTEAAKLAIRKLIDNENPMCPLSDKDIVSELEKLGIKLQRRTVSKYREQLDIPSTYVRKNKK